MIRKPSGIIGSAQEPGTIDFKHQILITIKFYHSQTFSKLQVTSSIKPIFIYTTPIEPGIAK